MEKDESVGKGKKKGRSSSNGKKKKQIPRKRNSPEKKKVENAVAIFTDEFLDLFRQQKNEIRSLKLNSSQLNEKVKLKDAEQEQIRLDNQKMRADFEEISQKNSFLKSQIDLLEKEFTKHFPNQLINSQFLLSLKEHSNEEDYQNKIGQIHQTVQL